MLGHSDRNCEVVYANPDKVIERAYGTWLRAPGKNAKDQNIGSRWLRNGVDGGQTWATTKNDTGSPTTGHGGAMVATRFMEVDGQVGEISGVDGGICFAQRNMGNKQMDIVTENQGEILQSGNLFENETVVLDAKRKRVENETIKGGNGLDLLSVDAQKNGPKNLQEAGPVVLQACLEK